MADDTINLELAERTISGKAVKRLRNEGQIPAVIHDHGKQSLSVQGPYLELYRIYQKAGKHHPIHLTAGKNTFTALIKTVTFDPRKNQLSHIVFNAVDKNQKVEAEIPVKARYAEDNESSPAERSSLIVLQQLAVVEVRAVPDKLPDVLEYDGEKLIEIGDQISVADLIVPDGVELITEPEHVIATVFEPSALAAANDDAGGDVDADATAVEAEEGAAEEGATDETANEEDGGNKEKEGVAQSHSPEQK